MSRFVGPTPVGEFAIALGLSALIGQLFETGAAAGLIHRRHVSHATSWAHTEIQVVSTILRLGLGVALLGPVAATFGDGVAELLLGLSLIQVIWALGATPRVLMERRLDFKRIAAVDGLALLFSSAAGITAAGGGWGRSALLLGGSEPALVLFTAQAVGNIILGPRQGPTVFVPLRELRWFMGFSRGFWVAAQFVPINLHWDRLVIGFFFGSAMAGLYDIAGRLAYLPMRLIMTLIGRVMLPFYARIQNDKPRLSRLLLTQLEVVGFLTALYFASFFFADSLGWPTLLLGDQWASVGWLVLGLSVAGLLRVMLFTIWPALIATGQQWALARYNIVHAAAMLVLAAPLAIVYGPAGVLVAVTIAGALSLSILVWTMNPRWVGSSSALPRLGLPLLALAVGVVSVIALPRGVAGIAWLIIAVWSAVSAGRGSAVILNLIRRARAIA